MRQPGPPSSQGTLALWVAVVVGALALVAGVVALTTADDETIPKPDVTRTQSSSESRQPAGLAVRDLLRVEVPFVCADATVVALDDGRYECAVPDPRGAVTHSVWVLGVDADDEREVQAAVGDLTGDGAREGALIVAKNQGQAGNPVVTAYVYASNAELITDVPDLPGRPATVTIVEGALELGGLAYGECNACPPGPPFTVTLRLDGDELVPAVPERTSTDVEEIRDRALSYLEDQEVDCTFALVDEQVFLSDVDATWGHVGWIDPSATPRCQGGTVALQHTATGWKVSAGFGHCPQAVDREFRERVGPNSGC